MEKEVKRELEKIIKNEYEVDWYFPWKEEYKQVDQIYMDNEKELVDLLYRIALDSNSDNQFSMNCMFVMQCLLVIHEEQGHDVTYIESVYKEMVLKVFEKPRQTKFKTEHINLLLHVFTSAESEALLRKHIEHETDPKIIKEYKYCILNYEFHQLFPKQGGFVYTMCILEKHTPGKQKTETLEYDINKKIKEYGIKIVQEWSEKYLNHEYASEEGKSLLRQVLSKA